MTAGMILVVVLVGPPTALVAWTGMPSTVLERAFEAGYAGQLLDAVPPLLILGAWLWWSVLVAQAAEAVRDVRRAQRQLAAQGGPAGQRSGSAAGVSSGVGKNGWRGVVSGVLLAPLLAPIPAVAAASPVTVSVAGALDAGTSKADQHEAARQDRGRAASIDHKAGAARVSAASVTASSSAAALVPYREIRVQPSGPTATLWGLAEHHLGDGLRWREIWDLNAGRQQDDGTVMRSPGLLIPGWSIRVPDTNTTDPQQRPDEPMHSVPAAARTRVETVAATATRPASPAKPPTSVRYTIAAGDRLGDIALRFLGDAAAYERIHRENRAVISNPDHIETGDTLTLPRDARDQGSRRHAQGATRAHPHGSTGNQEQPAHRPQNPQQPRTPDATATPTKPTATPSTPPRATRDASPPTPAKTAPTPPPSTTAPTEGTQSPTLAEDVRTQEDSADLPPWTAPAFGVSAAALAGLLLRRRTRRTTRARHAPPPRPDDKPRHREPELSHAREQAPDEHVDNPRDAAFDDDFSVDFSVDGFAGTHTDAAVDQARLLIQRTALALMDTDAPDEHDDPGEPWPARPEQQLQPSETLRTPPLSVPGTGAGPVAAPVPREHPRPTASRPADHPGVTPPPPASPPSGPALGLTPHTASPAPSIVPRRGRHVAEPPPMSEPPPQETLTATPVGEQPSPPATRPNGHHHEHASTILAAKPAHTQPQPAPSQGNGSSLSGWSRPHVRVTLLGVPGVLDARGHRVRGLRRNALQVLLYLALHPDGADLDDLRELIWPDIPLSKASKRLSSEIASVRRTVRTALGEPDNLDINAVDNTGSRYQLADFLDIDVWTFQRALDAVNEHTTDHPHQPPAPGQNPEPAGVHAGEPAAAREQALRQAVAAHTGRLADRADIDFPWLLTHRRRLNRAGAHARIALAELIHPHHPDDALALLDETARIDPGDRTITEHVHRTRTRLTG